MSIHQRLQADIAIWKADRKRTKGPERRNFFVIEPEVSGLWRLRVEPHNEAPRILSGLTPGEANQARLVLSDLGFIGKVSTI